MTSIDERQQQYDDRLKGILPEVSAYNKAFNDGVQASFDLFINMSSTYSGSQLNRRDQEIAFRIGKLKIPND